jgi:hypothetical protein
MKKKTIKDKILQNIEEDRKNAQEYIEKISEYLDSNTSAISGDEYSKIMMSAAKLLETNQKSNEQIVKLFEINKKFKPKVIKDENAITEKDLEDIYNRNEEVEM